MDYRLVANSGEGERNEVPAPLIRSRPRGSGRGLLRTRRILGSSGHVFVQPSIEDRYSRSKVIVRHHQRIDIVEVFLAGEAVGEVVAWVHSDEHFAAGWAEEDEAAD